MLHLCLTTRPCECLVLGSSLISRPIHVKDKQWRFDKVGQGGHFLFKAQSGSYGTEQGQSYFRTFWLAEFVIALLLFCFMDRQ